MRGACARSTSMATPCATASRSAPTRQTRAARSAPTTTRPGPRTAKCISSDVSASTAPSYAAARSTTTCRSSTTVPAGRCPSVYLLSLQLYMSSLPVTQQKDTRMTHLIRVRHLDLNITLASGTDQTFGITGMYRERDVRLPAAHARLAVQHNARHG